MKLRGYIWITKIAAALQTSSALQTEVGAARGEIFEEYQPKGTAKQK